MNAKTNSIAAQVAALPKLPIKELWVLWDKYFPKRPENPNRDYLESRIAYKIQEAAYGGLSPETRQRLASIGARHSKIKDRSQAQEIHLAPGTVLTRDWGTPRVRILVASIDPSNPGAMMRRRDGSIRTGL